MHTTAHRIPTQRAPDDQPTIPIPDRLDLTPWFEANNDRLDPDGHDVADEMWLEYVAADVAELHLIQVAALQGWNTFAEEYTKQVTGDIRDALSAGTVDPDGFLANPDLQAGAVEHAALVAYRAIMAGAAE